MRILMLPDDLILNCLARVSRLYYPSLSLVSKRFRTLVASTELYQTRTLLGRTENCLYVCLRLHYNSTQPRWFTLCRSPYSSRICLFPVSFPETPLTGAVAMVGHNIYVIGGLIDNNESSRVMVIDCRSHASHETSMQVARMCPSACVLDGKIYVIGGCKNLDSTNWIEVFDPKKHTWKFLQIPSEEICGDYDYESIGYEGTIYVMSKEISKTYKLHKGRWRAADLAINGGWGYASSYCVIENVFYCSSTSTIQWYDSKERLWKTLKGLERLPMFRPLGVKLADCGGKMVVLWGEDASIIRNPYLNKMIWCAEIGIEIRQNGEIWGRLDWFDVVFTTNVASSLVHALVTTI